jgi:hypothetical protein
MPVEFPQTQVAALQHLATQLIDKRKPGTDLGSLARELLRGFHDLCWLAGLDAVLDGLAQAHPGLDIADRSTLEDHEPLRASLVAQLEGINLDGGGPRNAKAKQLADCLIAALGLTPVETPDRKIVLSGEVRAELVAAMSKVIEAEIGKLRESVVEQARGQVVEDHRSSFTKMVAQLDDRGLQLLKVPKVPLDAQHAIERAFADARVAVITRIVGAALDAGKAALGSEAGKRIAAPITLKATPREVAARRAADPRVPKTAAAILGSILESLAELAQITFRSVEKPVLPYSASKTFTVGDVIEHPKFGRGSVVTVAAQRIEVEFGETKATLVHGR